MKKILIVDDDESIVTVTKLTLELAGYQVIVSYNANEAFKQLEKHQVDLILLDIMMPEIDGWEFLSNLKKNDKYQNIPVVIFTALSDKINIVDILEKGAIDYILKPYEPNELIEKISSLIKDK